jgi:PST family polysaccharide transporter
LATPPLTDPNSIDQTTLTQKAVKGTAWSTLSTVGRQLLQIASVTTVARVLGPGAYGIMAMAALLLAFVLSLRDLGTGMAIVQRLSVSNRLLSSLFWLNFLVGLVLAGFVAATSPLTAGFFHTPALIQILCVLSVSIWLTSCGIVHSSILLREMRYRSLAISDLGSALAGYIVALTFAHLGFGVWSLVFANVATAASGTLLYWFLSSWRPSLVFNRQELHSVAGFSLNLSGAVLVNFFARNADNIVIGRLRGQSELGDYQMAYNLMLTPISNISSMIGQITFPAFSRVQADNARFRSAYVRQSMIVGLLTFPIMTGMGILADPLIRVVLGTKWVGSIALFQILAPVGLVQSVATLVGNIYQAKARTDLMLRWALSATIALVVAFIIGAQFGTVGVASAYALTYLLLLAYPGFYVPFRLIGLRVRDYAAALLPQLLITAAMGSACLAWLWLLHSLSVHNSLLQLLTTSLLGACVYAGLLIRLRPPVMEALEEIMNGSGHPLVHRTVLIIQRLGRKI